MNTRRSTPSRSERTRRSSHAQLMAAAALFFALALPLAAQPGSVDLSFNSDDTPGKVLFGLTTYHEWVLDVAVDSQQRIVVAYGSIPVPVRGLFVDPFIGVRRYLPHGEVDLNFNGGSDYVSPSFWEGLFGDATALEVGPSDEIYLAFTGDSTLGGARGPGPNPGFVVELISSSGTRLAGTTVQFDLGPFANNERLEEVKQCGDSLYVLGSTNTGVSGSATDVAIAKLVPENLALDSSFDDDGRLTFAFDLGGEGFDEVSALACSGTTLYLAGTAETELGSQGFIAHLDDQGQFQAAFDSDGTILLSAPSVDWDDPARGGAPDPARVTWLSDLLVDSDGTLWAVGGASTPNGDTDAVVVALDDTGAAVTSIGTDGWLGFGFTPSSTDADDSFFRVLETSPTQRSLVGWNSASAIQQPFALRIDTSNGDLDSSFGTAGVSELGTLGFVDVFHVAQDRHGRILLGGYAEDTSDAQGLIARLRNVEIFVDEFERGDAGAWSATSP